MRATTRCLFARGLLASGAIAVFDEEPDVAGVVVRIRPKDPRFDRWSEELVGFDVDLDDEPPVKERTP